MKVGNCFYSYHYPYNYISKEQRWKTHDHGHCVYIIKIVENKVLLVPLNTYKYREKKRDQGVWKQVRKKEEKCGHSYDTSFIIDKYEYFNKQIKKPTVIRIQNCYWMNKKIIKHANFIEKQLHKKDFFPLFQQWFDKNEKGQFFRTLEDKDSEIIANCCIHSKLWKKRIKENEN